MMRPPQQPPSPAPAGIHLRLWGSVLATLLLVTGLPAAGQADTPHAHPAADCPVAGDRSITAALQPIRQKYGLPALAGAVVTSQGLRQQGVVGFRKAGTRVAATLTDHWHLGSDTKAMTAALTGRFVELELLKWDTTVAEVLPDLAEGFHPEMKPVTLAHLLSHRASLPANLDWGKIARNGSVQEQRLASVKQAFSKKPATKPGQSYSYSNLGYVVVAAMVEKLTRKTWEDCLRQQVLDPLQMRHAGFGGTGTVGQIDQPWGHTAGAKPVSSNGRTMDNPPVIWPGGGVHAPMVDWAQFIADQLRGARGERALLRASTYQALHTPPFGGEYALGWLVVPRDWGGGLVLNHDGCNTMNYAVAWLAPKMNFAILVCCNQGDGAAAKACDEAAAALIKVARQE